MASHGIKDRVAIVGMGCTRFAEHWDLGADDLLVAINRFCKRTLDEHHSAMLKTSDSGH